MFFRTTIAIGLGLLSCAGCTCSCDLNEPPASGLHVISNGEIRDDFVRRGAPGEYSAIWMNGRANGFIGRVFDPTTGRNGDYIAICLKSEGFRRVRQIGSEMWIDDDSRVAAWRDEPRSSVTLEDGSILSRAKDRHFTMDIHGLYFLLSDERGTEVFDKNRPLEAMYRTPDFVADNLFITGNRMVLAAAQQHSVSQYSCYRFADGHWMKLAQREMPGTMVQTDRDGLFALSYLKEDTGLLKWSLINLDSGEVTQLRIAPWCRPCFLERGQRDKR